MTSTDVSDLCQTDFASLSLTAMMKQLQTRTKSFGEKFDRLKTDYDDASHKQSEIIAIIAQSTEKLAQQRQTLENAKNECGLAEERKVLAEIGIELSLMQPYGLIYSPNMTHKFLDETLAKTAAKQWYFKKTVSEICSDLQNNHYCIIDDFMNPGIVQQILSAVQSMHANGELQPGFTGGGRSGTQTLLTTGKRFDLITYVSVDDQQIQDRIQIDLQSQSQSQSQLEPGTETSNSHENESLSTSSAFVSFVFEMDSLMNALCVNLKELQPKYINRGDIMVSCYESAQEAYYVKHVDNPNKNGRILTVLLYLNQAWSAADNGGCLRIQQNQNQEQEQKQQKAIEISPEFNRLVLFWSDKRTFHEVLPTKRRDRFAVSVWYMDVAQVLRTKYTTTTAQ